MPKQQPFVTATDIYEYLACPHWPYYDRYATAKEKLLRRQVSESESRRREDGIAHERRIIEEKSQGQTVMDASPMKDMAQSFAQTLEWMRQGVEWIYQGSLIHGRWAGRPDILKKHPGKSVFGDWYYVPLDIKSTHGLEKYQKLQLAFYSDILGRIQGYRPKEAGIFNIDKELVLFEVETVAQDLGQVVSELEAIIFDKVKPNLVLRKDCFDRGVWGELCRSSAESADDISLLYNVNVQKLATLRKLGIQTVKDAARMEPASLAGKAPGLTLHSLETIKLQARSLKEKSVIIRKSVELPPAELEIHFDIESSPPHGIDYLYGCLLRWPDGREEYRCFVSRSEAAEAEGEMWRQFLDWLATLPLDYVVYHYSPYEIGRLSLLSSRHGTSHWLDYFRNRMVDLAVFTKHNVTFPLYFYGLKDVAKFLGFRWRGDLVKSGGESVDQFQRFLETGDESVLQAIVDYNEDDVRATACLKDWLLRYAGSVKEYQAPYPWA
jgi:uncharacterized protein